LTSLSAKSKVIYFIILKADPSYLKCLKLCLKEEQHANTSANYDVELLHHKDAHVDFLRSGKRRYPGFSPSTQTELIFVPTPVQCHHHSVCQLDTNYIHLGKGHLNWRIDFISLACGCLWGIFLIAN
jgi:hypothetical protein